MQNITDYSGLSWICSLLHHCLLLILDSEIIMKNIKSSRKTNQDSHRFYLHSGEWKFQKVKIIERTESLDNINTSIVTYEVLYLLTNIFLKQELGE